MTRLFVVTGLETEARLVRAALRRHRCTAIDIACAAMRAERAYALTATAIRDGAEMVVSFGLCGGLDPALGSGSLVVAQWVVAADGSAFATDAPLQAQMIDALSRSPATASGGRVVGVDAPVRSAREKQTLAARYQAHAVDMESHGVLRAAHEAGVPALVLRAVADPAERSLPPTALAGVGTSGEVRPLAVMGALVKRPRDGPAVLRLAADARRARLALAIAAGCLADLFGRD